MNGENYNWSRFEINYYYPALVGEVFTAWSTGAGLKSFFIEKIRVETPNGTLKKDSETFSAGDKYSWDWRHDFSVAGEFRRVIKDKLVEFSFGSMLVAVEFTALPDSTLVRLIQMNIPTTELGRATSHMNCRICWTFFMTNLKSVLLNGTDLRDLDPARASSFEVGYVPKELS